MFEHWSEERRRWFLITFCAVAWALFASSIQHLGDESLLWGISPEARVIAGIVSAWAFLCGAASLFRLRFRDWVVAAAFGITLTTALIDFGLRDHVVAGVWSLECDNDNAQSCAQLADYFADGRSVVHGWQDAEALHHRACAGGIATSCRTPQNAVRLDHAARCAKGYSTDCHRAAALTADLQARYELYDHGCAVGDVASCEQLLDSGYPDRRLIACTVLEAACRTSSAVTCSATAQRCDLARTPTAGVRN